MAGRKGAVPTLVILAVNLNSLRVIMCQSGSSCWIRYADDARQFSSMAHCKKYICLSSRYADLASSSMSTCRSAKSVTRNIQYKLYTEVVDCDWNVIDNPVRSSNFTITQLVVNYGLLNDLKRIAHI